MKLFIDDKIIAKARATSKKKAEEKASQLPTPSGYHVLVALPEAEEKYESGIVKADTVLRHEELLTTVLFVVKMGPDCYLAPL